MLTASDIKSMEDGTAKLANRMEFKHDIFLDDVCKNDQSVRFYTGIPSLDYLFMNLLKPMAAKMKYGVCANSLCISYNNFPSIRFLPYVNTP